MFDTPSPSASPGPSAVVLLGTAAFLVVAGGALALWLASRRRAPSAHLRAWRLVFPEGAHFPAAQAAAWFASLAPYLSAGGSRPWVELRGDGGRLRFVLGVPGSLQDAVRGQLAAWFPEARLEPLEEGRAVEAAGCAAAPLMLARPPLFPLRKTRPREPDPLLGIVPALLGGSLCGLRLEVGPEPPWWQDWARTALAAWEIGSALPPTGRAFLLSRAWQLLTETTGRRPARGRAPERRSLEEKARAPVLSVRAVAWASASSPDSMRAAEGIAAQAEAATRDPLGNALKGDGVRAFPSLADALAVAPELPLAAAELALLFHVPGGAHPLVAAEASRVVPPAVEALEAADPTRPGAVPLGEALTPDGAVPFALPAEARARHLYSVGKTGTGKSTLLAGIARADLLAGRGFALLDPHGDLAEQVLGMVPPERHADVVCFDPADPECVVPLNPLAAVPAGERPLVASAVLGTFKHLFADSWGPRLEHILRHALLLLLEGSEPSLAQLPLVLTDAEYRERLLRECADPLVRGFFRGEFAGYEGRFRSEALAPVLNKVGHFLGLPAVRLAVGGRTPGLSLRGLMDRGGVLVANLAAGRIGEDASALLGGLLVAGFQAAALARADRPAGERPPFALIADEFQRFAGEAFAQVLSESRKYGLSLALAHQYLDQVPPEVLAAVLGNAGSLAVFRAGSPDARRLAQELAPMFTPEDLVNLPAHRFCARLHRDGGTLPAFSARTVSLPPSKGIPRELVEASRERWARPRAAVETELADLWEGRDL